VDLNYIIYVVTIVATSDIKVVVARVNNNTSLNNYTSVNKSTRRATTDFAYNKKSNIGSI
jgi:hypothetical protein